MELNLSGQQAAVNQMQPYIDALKNKMDNRKVIWDKLPVEKKRKWVTSGKDPIMSLAWSIYKYLRNNFFDMGVDEDG